MTDYLIDTNVFIQAKNLHYGFDYWPAFRDWLVDQNRTGRVASIEKLADELRAGEDDPAGWDEERGANYFLRPDVAMVPALRAVCNWASRGGYQPAAAANFLPVAGYLLVEHALARGCAIVTYEVPSDSIR